MEIEDITEILGDDEDVTERSEAEKGCIILHL